MSSIPYSNLTVRYQAYKPTRIEQNEQKEQEKGKTQERPQNKSVVFITALLSTLLILSSQLSYAIISTIP
jgi:hypothetical protein